MIRMIRNTGSVTVAKSHAGSPMSRRRNAPATRSYWSATGHFAPPLLPEPAFEEALDQVPEECTGGQQGDGQEGMLRQAGKRELAGKPDQDKPGDDAGKNPGEKTPVGLSIPENTVAVGIILPKINGSTSPRQRCNRVRDICGKHDPERPNQWYYQKLNTNNVALQYL